MADLNFNEALHNYEPTQSSIDEKGILEFADNVHKPYETLRKFYGIVEGLGGSTELNRVHTVFQEQQIRLLLVHGVSSSPSQRPDRAIAKQLDQMHGAQLEMARRGSLR